MKGMSVPETDAVEVVRFAAVRVNRRIDDDDLGAVLLACSVVQHRHRVRLGRVGAEEEQRFELCSSLKELVIAP